MIMDTNIPSISGTALPSKPDGFTLIEVLMALAVFAIGFLAVATMQTTSIQGNTNAYRKTDMTAAATAHIENLLSFEYDDTILAPVANFTVDITADGIDNDYNGTVDDASDSGPGSNNIRVHRRIIENFPLENTKTIEITIIYTNRSGQTRQIQVQSNLADII